MQLCSVISGFCPQESIYFNEKQRKCGVKDVGMVTRWRTCNFIKTMLNYHLYLAIFYSINYEELLSRTIFFFFSVHSIFVEIPAKIIYEEIVSQVWSSSWRISKSKLFWIEGQASFLTFSTWHMFAVQLFITFFAIFFLLTFLIMVFAIRLFRHSTLIMKIKLF